MSSVDGAHDRLTVVVEATPATWSGAVGARVSLPGPPGGGVGVGSGLGVGVGLGSGVGVGSGGAPSVVTGRVAAGPRFVDVSCASIVYE